MTDDEPKKTTEPPLKLDMAFDEAFVRFARVDLKEVAVSIERSKTKKPPEPEPERPITPSRRRKLGNDH